ncbi:MAG: alkaline phosphatase family protein [Nitrospirae bacterium]|nr:alkaline phosphatase family protein [Nitrospirota bacterium]
MLGFLKKKLSSNDSSKKVIVLGIDGVPYSLLVRFMNEGLMPNLSAIAKKGTLTDMNASIPEVSSTSWSTFMTGVNPGKHGIYGFMEVQKDSYKWRFPNSSDIKSGTLWDMAGRHDKKSIVLNLPSTYPAKKLNGILTAGFVALDLKKATYPESAYEYLKSIDYRMDVDTQKAKESLSALSADIDQAFDIRKNAILHFLDHEEWDLFIGVITETDRLHHYLWRALEDKSHSEHEFFINFYKKLDALIGEFYKRAGQEIPFIIVSDHGSTAIKKEIYLNSWLREKGYLKFKKEPPGSFEEISEDSRVFVLDPSRFYIHLKEKYSRGCVDAGEYEGLRRKLKEELLSLEIDGEKIIKTVFMKEELYSGNLYNDAPDLVALPVHGYDLKGAVNKTETAGRSQLTGGHTRDDAVFFINRDVRERDINILDIGPTIISLLGIKGENFDGRCLV